MFLLLYCFLLVLPFFIHRIRDVFQPELVVNAYFVLFIAMGPLAMMVMAPQLFQSGQYEFVTSLVLVGYVAINLGFLAASFQVRGHGVLGGGRFSRRKFDSRGWRGIAILLLLLSLASLAVFFLRAGQIPIFAENKEAARVEALSVGGNGYLLYLATLGMTAVLLYSSVEYWDAVRKRVRPSSLVFIFAAIVGIALAGTGSRRYFFWTCLYVLIARHYIYKSISVRFLVVFGVLGFVGVNLFEMYRNVGSDTTVDFLTTSYYRLIVYFYNLEAAFSAFQNSELMWGSTLFMDVLTVLPGKQIDYQSWIKEVTGLEFEGFGVPPTVMGDMYINFGIPGVVLGCFIFGYAIRAFYYLQTSREVLTPLSILAYALVLEISIRTLTSGVSAQTMGLLWIVVVYFSIVGFKTALYR